MIARARGLSVIPRYEFYLKGQTQTEESFVRRGTPCILCETVTAERDLLEVLLHEVLCWLLFLTTPINTDEVESFQCRFFPAT